MRASRRETVLLLVLASLFWFSIYIFSPTTPNYAQSLGASAGMVGVIGGSYGLMQVLFRVPIGIASDRMGRRKPFIIAGMLFAMAANAVPLLLPSVGGLLAGRAFSGMVAACWVSLTVLVVLRSSLPPAQAMARLSVFTYLGQIPANLLGGMLAGGIAPWAPYVVGAAASLAALLLCFGIREEKLAREPVALTDLLRVGLIPRLLLISIVALLYQFASFATTSNFTPILMRGLGAPDALVGLMSAINASAIMVGALLITSGRLRRFNEGFLVVVGLAVVAVCVALMPAARSPGVIVVQQAVMGMGGGLCFPVLSSMSIKCVPREKSGAATGFYQSIYALGILLGPMLNGVLADAFSLTTGYLVVAAVALAGAGLAARLMREQA